MAEKDKNKVEVTLVDSDNVEVTELEEQDLDEVSGGLTDTNCGCSVHQN
jgi:hypothetical protein